MCDAKPRDSRSDIQLAQNSKPLFQCLHTAIDYPKLIIPDHLGNLGALELAKVHNKKLT